ncbi:zinc finger protein 638 isoform X2 [Ambystoma mexicanum]|uniref:zinc finger protein 638 isoform X2 n=1 Tax=Ambystoma mexicanum TaxID=8296 RepID=UPI0037E9C434
MKGFGVNQFAVNQSAINSGPFMGSSPGGMNLQGISQRLDGRGIHGPAPPGYMPRFASPHGMGQQNLHQPGTAMVPHSEQLAESRISKEQVSLREAVHQLAMETKPGKWGDGLGSSGNSSTGMGLNQMSSPQVLEQSRNPQSRYNTESASSILATFGLSNEDLEELSRYPDDQLTPENMPLILREIRMRKMSRQVPSMSSQGRGVGGDSIKSKVFDYGHSSKFGYSEDPVQARVFRDPLGEEPRTDYRGLYAQSSVEARRSDGNPARFPVDKQMGQLGFQKDTTNKQMNYSGTPSNKMPTLGPSGGQKMKSVSATSPGLPIDVLERKFSRNTGNLTNQPNVQIATPHMTSMPGLKMTTPPSNFQMGNSPNFQISSTPPNFSIGSTSPSFQMGSNADVKTMGSPRGFQAQDGSMRPPTMSPSAGHSSFGKGPWPAKSPLSDGAKTKQMPTPSMMNDYYAASPRIFPHVCSLCNVECKHLKEWIQHQNTSTHIESCRQIRNKYPDWNPQALGSLRNEADKKENQNSRRRSGSAGSSPRHSRSSGSGHRARRSRSPEKFARRRTRSRSRSRSPRRASRRSPRRSRSPRRLSRSSPRYRKTASGERSSSKTSRSPEKKSAGQTSSSASKTEMSKQKNEKSSTIKKMPGKPESKVQNLKKVGSDGPSTRKPGFATISERKPDNDSTTLGKPTGSDSNSSKLVSSSSSFSPKPSTDTLSKKANHDSTAALSEGAISASEESKKSLAKQRKPTHSEAPVPPPAPVHPPKEAYNSLPWFKNKMDPGTVIHISDLPDDGYTDQDILKVVQPFGKASDILIVRSKNEAYLEMSFREAAIAAIKFSKTVPVMINKKRITLSSVGHKPQPAIVERRGVPEVAQKKETVKTIPVPRSNQTTNHKPPSEKAPEKPLKPNFSQPKQTSKAVVNPKPSNVGIVKAPEVKEPALQKTDHARKEVPVPKKKVKVASKDVDYGVILVTNFPEKDYTAEEIANLAKPFGGVKDVILLSSHKQAYLQMSQSSAESMIKFYTVFPMSLAGKQLSIKLIPKYKSVKDVERIFADIIEAEESKPNPEIYEQFVHLRNLPKDGFTDLEVAYVGLRFGKVNNYVVIRNKQKAILQLDTAKNAKAMFTFLLNYPCNLGSSTLRCTLSAKRKLLPGETVTNEESDECSDVENKDEAECAQMAFEPQAKSKVAENVADQTLASSMQKDVSKEKPGSNDPQSSPNMLEMESGDKVITLSSKPYTKLVKSGVLKKKLIKKKTTSTLEPFSKSLKLKRIAVKPKVVKKLKGKILGTTTSQVANVGGVDKSNISSEGVNRVNPETLSALEKVTDPDTKNVPDDQKACSKTSSQIVKTGVKAGVDSRTSGKCEKKGGFEVPKNKSKVAVGSGKYTTKNGNNQTRTEKTTGKAAEVNQDKAQIKVETRNSSDARSGVANKAGSANGQSSSLISSKQGSMAQKMSTHKSGEDLKASSKPETIKRVVTGTRAAGKETLSSDSKRNIAKSQSSLQEKERGECRGVSKQQEKDSKSNSTKDDNSSASLEDHELFPFNMDEFVTVDEIMEETVEENVDVGKRTESIKESLQMAADSKRLTLSPPKQNPSFVTLDEVGEDDVFAAQPEASPESDAQLQTPAAQKDKSVAKSSHLIMTSDEVSDEDLMRKGNAKDTGHTNIEGKSKPISKGKPSAKTKGEHAEAKPAVTGKLPVRSIRGKVVEENKETAISKDRPFSIIKDSCCLDASESKVHGDEHPLVTEDDLIEEDEDFMSNLFNEEHQFVTVDEVGDEDEEDETESKPETKSELVDSAKTTSPRQESPKPKGSTSQGIVGPNKRLFTAASEKGVKTTSGKTTLQSDSSSLLGSGKKRQQEQCTVELSKYPASNDNEIESKRRKLDSPSKMDPYDPMVAVGLEFLIPKTGYFCELCSLFYMDNASKIKHCKTLRHYNCVEKHMAQQHESHLTEDPSSTDQENP